MSALGISTFPAFVAYCIVQGITPGPANLCAFATVLQHGTKAALRLWWGLLLGFLVVSLASLCIAWSSFAWLEDLLPAISMLGAIYVVWLAWHLVHSSNAPKGKHDRKPTVLSGFIVQVVNVKIVLLCLTALFSYAVPYTQDPIDLAIFGILMPLIGVSCNMMWILAGSHLQKWYGRHRRGTDMIMAASLLACAVTMVV